MKIALVITAMYFSIFMACTPDNSIGLPIEEKIEAFQLDSNARAVVKWEFRGEAVYGFFTTDWDTPVLNSSCDTICRICGLCALPGNCEEVDFLSNTENKEDIWRK